MTETVDEERKRALEREGASGVGTAWRKWLVRATVLAGLALAGWLLYRTLGRYSFDELVQSVTSFPLGRLASAGLFAAASYVCLTGFDALAVRYVGKRLAYPRVALASFVSLSLGHSIGFAGLSSGAIRYRFYSRWGLSIGDVSKVILFSGMTVGVGLATLGGVSILLRPALAAELIGIPQSLVLALGLGSLAATALYLIAATFVKGRLRIRKWTLEMPDPRLALAQVAVGSLNFALVAGCLHQALSAVTEIPYLTAVTAFILANMGVLVTHVPGGLGIIEAVIVYLLPQVNVIGALLVFRFVYFLAPLVIGSIVFAVTELVWRSKASKDVSAER
ncbi:lysylphosphatidylglycerol synthase domain-containing protein [Aurantimonas marina]|uniref:lysylphosphatidylglycerol synthase domain-containing protein n=1 Tax=Aurantimonas marina TaxID=2780508 RepID=UPI0019D024A2|nr:lysylphosphatidylglycerol synthase domain-containing protein [Aurantimonas marina]